MLLGFCDLTIIQRINVDFLLIHPVPPQIDLGRRQGDRLLRGVPVLLRSGRADERAPSLPLGARDGIIFEFLGSNFVVEGWFIIEFCRSSFVIEGGLSIGSRH